MFGGYEIVLYENHEGCIGIPLVNEMIKLALMMNFLWVTWESPKQKLIIKYLWVSRESPSKPNDDVPTGHMRIPYVSFIK